MTPPLITFGLVAFQQERFICEAVQAAFAQTYSPLEIVITDDCSSDRTFKLIEEMAHGYQGPHRVIINRNPARRGLGGQINAVMELSRGELVVIAAGDDISIPERTSIIHAAWEQSSQEATSLYSSHVVISEDGTELGVGGEAGRLEGNGLYQPQNGSLLGFIRDMSPLVSGCTNAWSRKLFDFFGPLGENVLYEDMATSFRTLALGKMIYINRPLVKYRRHEGNLSFFHLDADALDREALARLDRKEKLFLKGYAAGYEQLGADLETLLRKKRLPASEVARLQREARSKARYYALRLRLLDAPWLYRPLLLCQIGHLGGWRDCRRLAPRLLPAGLFSAFKISRNRLFSAWRRQKPATSA